MENVIFLCFTGFFGLKSAFLLDIPFVSIYNNSNGMHGITCFSWDFTNLNLSRRNDS